MATFKDLSDKDRIMNIKDSLVLLLGSLASAPDTLTKYIKAEKPTFTETTSDEEKAKLEANYQTQLASFNKVMEFLRSCKKAEECVCIQGCWDVDHILNSVLPPEFEPLLIEARKIAESRSY